MGVVPGHGSSSHCDVPGPDKAGPRPSTAASQDAHKSRAPLVLTAAPEPRMAGRARSHRRQPPCPENAQEPSQGSASLQAQDPGAGGVIDTFAKREGRKGGGQQGAETPSGGMALGGCAPPFRGLLPTASSLCSAPSPSS